ncbi:hypothetical protein Pfo_018154 [Paulownia fortunei]|nr:hypothetical protein Pfo_018154 [Paulownia fortunei]
MVPISQRRREGTRPPSNFYSFKLLNDGKNYSFMIHERNSLNSSHKIAVKHCHDLMNLLQHIEKIIDKQSMELVANNRLRLKVSIDVARLCAFQGITLRAHNECLDSHNRGNFLEIMKHIASYNDEVRSTILKNAPQNASYTSPQIQKEILSLYASRIQRFIREEIGDAKYCLIVDKSRDESKREQMAIVLRFVDKEGFIRERFFDLVHVEDTKSSTLKREIFSVLSHNNLIIQNIRGQGYDGASTMRGEWNGLQALFLNECSYAYYVHCFVHRLQLTLVSTTQKLFQVLSKIGKTMNYYVVDRLIKLILTLPVSTVTTERAFSSMKFVKTRLRNKIEDDFLASLLLMYIEKEIAQTFSIDSIIDEFDVMKKRRAQFRMPRLNK